MREQEKIEELSRVEFFAQLYRCSFFHYLWNCGNLPEADKQLLASVLRDSVEKIADKFAPRVLMAHLHGDISTTLRGVL